METIKSRYYVYVIKSKIKDVYYIGQTENLLRRIEIHNGTHAG